MSESSYDIMIYYLLLGSRLYGWNRETLHDVREPESDLDLVRRHLSAAARQAPPLDTDTTQLLLRPLITSSYQLRPDALAPPPPGASDTSILNIIQSALPTPVINRWEESVGGA